MGRRVLGAALGAAALVVALGGCGAFPVACPAIGWTNTVEVRVPGSADADSPVHEVAFCAGTDCTPGEAPVQTPPPTDGATPAAPAPLPPGFTNGPEGSPVPSPYWSTTEHDGEQWNVMLPMSAPERGRVALRDVAGTTVAERAVDLTWTRHGGSEQCGGPSTARTTVRP